MRPQGLSVVIPCLNESETIKSAVESARKAFELVHFPGEVVVADNGSTDGSQEIARAAGARVVDVPKRGYGAALDAGIRAAKYEYVVFGDADLSYPLHHAFELCLPLMRENADIVLGSRLGGLIEPGAMPFLNRRLGTPVLNRLIRLWHGLPTSDCNSGMRAIRRSAYENLRMQSPGMEFASEMLVNAAKVGWRYDEVPIHFKKDQRSRPPHLKRWRDGWRHLRLILGHASPTLLISAPLVAATMLFAFAIYASFGLLIGSPEKIRFHSAFVAIAIATPLSMFAAMNMILQFSLGESAQANSVLSRFLKMSERAQPFYVAVFLFALAFAEVALMTGRWASTGFQDLFEIGGVIRLMCFTSMGTVLFATDLVLGLIQLTRTSQSR